ncbi:MAG: hypothetical protein AAFY73_04555 [Pseudomonadota bacterium]
MIEALFGGGAGLAAVHFFTNLALFVLGAEILAIILLGQKVGLPRRFLPNALAGFSILVALRLHLSDFAGEWVILALFFSLLAHAADLQVRRKN